ncbi:MAG: flagellar biosynthetic protein FliO [Armatimonadota bacterium]|nr:flagellar biosynthetic protein FliO [Armatimonadota bacterium]MDR5675702.1 flagellar biosynthetic protein FliO [Armatimonadota bacterium]MDR5689455.1 flagellar biosynthetic protein FliO [Armatimonadota bacterium]MDR7386638.1 flagellar biosynthetic protein FliO [Armatimonadota bacterium]MDR7392303.1 flagellar biosynthetic protein FliO [Armatimonadota bacterium]
MKRAALLALLLAVPAQAAGPAEASGSDFGTAQVVLQAVAGLALVVGLVVLTRYALVRLGAAGGSGSVRLREVVRLSPQQALYVVEVEGRRLLLGQHVHLVAELGPAPAGGTEVAFAQRLRDATRRLRGVRQEGR